jgi:hypothetical protein
LACAVAGASGGLAVLLAPGEVLQPELETREFFLTREASDPLRVEESKPLQLLQAYADFDLFATVELHEDSELDFVLRRVEPRIQERPVTVAGAARSTVEEIVPFHGRFTVLRLSTRAEGPPYRTREDALFADDLTGGVKLQAGLPASVLIEARGRRMRANVAGRWLPWCETIDDHGSTAAIVRGGPALVRYLKITPRDAGFSVPPWAIGALLALLAAALALARGATVWRTALAFALALPAGAWIAARVLFVHLLPWAAPEAAGLLAGALLGLPLAVAFAACSRLPGLVLAIVAAPLLLAGAAQCEQRRLQPLDDPRLDLHFGPKSGPAPFEALARRVRSGDGIHTLADPEPRIVFLGGASLFEADPDLAAQVGFGTTAAVRRETGKTANGIVLATPSGNALQQLLLFRRFYLDFAPRVVVFGVTSAEGAGQRRMRVRVSRDLIERGELRPSPCALYELWRRRAGGDQPVATPEDLEQTLGEVEALCRERGIPLLLVTEQDLAGPMRAVVERFAAAHALPFLGDVLTSSGEPVIDALAAGIAARL